jgi:hypothetical protein
LPPWLAGCGSDDCDDRIATPVPSPTPSPTPGARPREQRTLHLSVSFAPVRYPVLHVHGSQSHRAPIPEHTAESPTLNYEVVANAPRIEPSLSQWNPSTPEGCPTPPPTPSA